MSTTKGSLHEALAAHHSELAHYLSRPEYAVHNQTRIKELRANIAALEAMLRKTP